MVNTKQVLNQEELRNQKSVLKIITAATNLGFQVVDEKTKKRNAKMVVVIPPKNERGKDSLKGIVLKKDLDGLVIRLIIPFDNKTQRFTKHGTFWIVVSKSLPEFRGKPYYIEPLFRVFNFAERVINHLTAIHYLMNYRPVSTKATGAQTLMVPFRNTKGLYEFVARENNKIIERKPMMTTMVLPSEARKYIYRWQDIKLRTVARRKKTKAKPISSIRKKARVKLVK